MANEDPEGSRRKMAFEAHMAHYDAIRSDIGTSTSLQNNLVNYSIAVIGGSIVFFSLEGGNGVPFLSQYPFVLLVISLLMSLMTWASLEAEIRIHDSMHFIDHILRIKVQRLIGPGGETSEYHVFRTEVAEISREQVIRTIFRGLLVSGKFLVAYIPALVYLVLYLVEYLPRAAGEWYLSLLLWAAIFAAAIVPLSFISQIIFVSRHYWGKDALMGDPQAQTEPTELEP